MFEKMLVCLDGSPLSEQIVPYALKQAQLSHCEVVLLHVISEPFLIMPGVPGAPGYPVQTDSMVKQLGQDLENARKYLNHIALSFRKLGLKVTSITLEGSAGELIVKYASENKIDLIAIATHGRSGISRAVLGSVADYVLKEGNLPLLLLKPQAEKSKPK
jgi:nucleotide-binding universal stress UspA family protein